MEYISNENGERLSWLILKMWRFIVSWCVWNIYKSLKNYELCLNHYLIAPTLGWDAMLNMTKVVLELISNADMYLFFEKGMRSTVSYISKRYSEVNNKYLKCYYPKQESKYIIYLDTNNLYGYTVSSNKQIEMDRCYWVWLK